jgi:anti-sigma factor RsiW
LLTCRELIERLWRYREGEPIAEERAACDAHLRVCPPCVRYVEGYEAAIHLGREALRDPGGDASRAAPVELIRAVLASRGR